MKNFRTYFLVVSLSTMEAAALDSIEEEQNYEEQVGHSNKMENPPLMTTHEEEQKSNLKKTKKKRKKRKALETDERNSKPKENKILKKNMSKSEVIHMVSFKRV